MWRSLQEVQYVFQGQVHFSALPWPILLLFQDNLALS
jgi:hypothetical protein